MKADWSKEVSDAVYLYLRHYLVDLHLFTDDFDVAPEAEFVFPVIRTIFDAEFGMLTRIFGEVIFQFQLFVTDIAVADDTVVEQFIADENA